MTITRRGLLKRLGLATAAATIAPALPVAAKAHEAKEAVKGFGFAPVKAEGGPVCNTFGGEVPEAMKWAFNEQVKAELRESGSMFATGNPRPKAIQFAEVSDPDSWDA